MSFLLASRSLPVADPKAGDPLKYALGVNRLLKPLLEAASVGVVASDEQT
jgi:hypothetical protein